MAGQWAMVLAVAANLLAGFRAFGPRLMPRFLLSLPLSLFFMGQAARAWSDGALELWQWAFFLIVLSASALSVFLLDKRLKLTRWEQ